MRAFQMKITKDRDAAGVMRLMNEWAERTRCMIAQLVYLSAESVYDDLLLRLPKGEEWAAYRDSLEVVKVSGGSKDIEAIYAVRSNPKSRKVRRMDAPKTVVYIRSHQSRLRRVKPEIATLEKYSPWTLQGLPFMPDRRDATMISRKVTKSEVRRVAKARMADKPKWRKELERAGVRQSKIDNAIKIPKNARAVPDVAFEALRMEFGLGTKPLAHWKPAIQKLTRSGIEDILRQQPSLVMALTLDGFRGWQSWPQSIRGKTRASQAKAYSSFQKKLGIRISR